MQIRKHGAFYALSLTAVIIFVFKPGRSLEPSLVSAQDDNETWVTRNYGTALSLVLPNDDEDLPSDARWRVTVRVEPPFDKPETGFSITKFYNGKLETLLVTPEGESILTQLGNLRTTHQTVDLKDLTKMLRIKRQQISERDCTGLTRLAVAFEKMRISANVEDDLRVDETGYVVWSRARWGNNLRVRLGGRNSARQSHPLLAWIEKFRSTVSKCSSI